MAYAIEQLVAFCGGLSGAFEIGIGNYSFMLVCYATCVPPKLGIDIAPPLGSRPAKEEPCNALPAPV